MIYVLKGKRFRLWPSVIVLAAYALLAIAPQVIESTWAGTDDTRIGWWPLVLAVAIMIVCMATDAFNRPVVERVAFILVGIVLYLAILWPVFQLISYWLIRSWPGDARDDAHTWALMRTVAAFPLVTYSTRRSTLFETPRNQWEDEE